MMGCFRYRQHGVGLMFSGINIKFEKLCLVRKILSQKKTINLSGLHYALTTSWNPKKDFKVSKIGEKLYLFQFANVRNLNKVLYKVHWNFSNSLIIFKKYQASLAVDQCDFSTNLLWVQIFDVPISLHFEYIGRMIGSSLGKVLDVDENFNKVLWVKVELDVNKPLKRFKTTQITFA